MNNHLLDFRLESDNLVDIHAVTVLVKWLVMFRPSTADFYMNCNLIKQLTGFIQLVAFKPIRGTGKRIGKTFKKQEV